MSRKWIPKGLTLALALSIIPGASVAVDEVAVARALQEPTNPWEDRIITIPDGHSNKQVWLRILPVLFQDIELSSNQTEKIARTVDGLLIQRAKISELNAELKTVSKENEPERVKALKKEISGLQPSLKPIDRLTTFRAYLEADQLRQYDYNRALVRQNYLPGGIWKNKGGGETSKGGS